MPHNIYIIDDSGDDSLTIFLEQELVGGEGFNSRPGKLWSYFERGRYNSPDRESLCLRVLGRSAYSTKSHKLRSPEVLDSVSSSVAIACIYGACRCLVDLLKAWVDERRGRKLHITCGEKEITIEGGVSKDDLKEAVRILESRLGKSKGANQQ